MWARSPSSSTETKAANRSYLIAPDGEIVARYDKLHMFDVDLAGGESYRESRTFHPGDKAVLADLPWGRLGLSICYDLRFAALYRALATAGAHFIAVPSAFTKQTGEAHWRVLLRARAIETGAFVLAAAQGGLHENGRSTYGHSMIVSPWGEVLAEAGEDPQILFADIDLGLCAEARAKVPSLQPRAPIRGRDRGRGRTRPKERHHDPLCAGMRGGPRLRGLVRLGRRAMTSRRRRRRSSAPACGSVRVGKAPMAPYVAKRSPQPQAPERAPRPKSYAMLRKLRAEITANADYVGAKFPEEARKIHFEEAAPRNIYGEATLEEARELTEEGIPVCPLPPLPEDQN